MSDHLSATFVALSDPTRRAILARLALGETSVKELAMPFSISAPSISKYLKVLAVQGNSLLLRNRKLSLNRHAPRALVSRANGSE
jgi:DNA-binding transcriptional ArsR family regulator